MDVNTTSSRPVWVEINLAAVKNNVGRIKKLLKPNVKFCAVVKADAYGHGVVAVARTVLAAGAEWLAVAILNEAVELRKAGFTVPILILGYTPACQADLVAAYNITQTIYSLDMAAALSAAAVNHRTKVKVHIKIDTGMSRIGITPETAGEFAAKVAELPGLEIEGVFSHFATADCADKTYAREQFAGFNQALAAIAARGITVPIRHIANSAATLEMPETHLDMVRPGIILYGLWPSDEVTQTILLEPAMCLKAQVAYVKQVAARATISYGRTYTAESDRCIATLPIGYADGWSRRLSGKTGALIRGEMAPITGRICMDQCMVDVTDIPGVEPGDIATLFGVSELTVDAVAGKLGTINYEVVCMVGKRVPRVYVDI